VSPHAWKPALQVSRQAAITQATVPLRGVGQGVQRAPQVAASLSDTQRVPQAW
jgi:hypothetical protein